MGYQGHHSDGSSIQRHSAGGGYPYVMGRRGDRWIVIGPGFEGEMRFATWLEADMAIRRLLAVRENDDAWAFECERLQTFAQQRLAPMQAAAALIGQGSWALMSRHMRVASLIALGRARSTLRLPPGTPRPAFQTFYESLSA